MKTLLSIYGDWPSDLRLQAEWGKAWADDLEWFPMDVIEAALVAWRRAESRRPTPADIIRLCRERMPKVVSARVSPPAERGAVSDAARARNRARVEAAFPELRRFRSEGPA